MQHLEMLADMVKGKKYRKFFRFAIPILVVEILAIIGLLIYLIILPKNYCRINTNYDNAIIYVNNKKTKKLRFTSPNQQMLYNFYEFEVSLEIKESGTFNVSYTLNSDYIVFAQTNLAGVNGKYSLSVQGNTKTKLLSGLTIKSETPLKNFDVYINIEITKV